MPEIIRNLKVEASTPRSRRSSDSDDEPYRGPIQTGIVGRLTIASAPREQEVGPACEAYCPVRPWSKTKKKAVLNLVGKIVVHADPIEVDDE